MVKCDTTIFSTKTRLYWQWNCDSSWLTFETKKGTKRIIQTFKEDELPKTESIRPRFIKEFDSKLWFKQQKVPGCCYPPSHFLLNAKVGTTLWEVQEDLFVQENQEKNLVFYFSDTTFTQLVAFDLMKNKKTNYTIPKNRILKTLKMAKVPFVSEIFEKSRIVKSQVEMYYNYYKEDGRKQWVKDTIQFKIGQ